MDKDTFFMGKKYCSTHTACTCCPIKDQCQGAYEMLPAAFKYIKELEAENAKLRKTSNG